MEQVSQLVSIAIEILIIISFLNLVKRSKEIIKKQEEQEQRLNLIIQQQNKMNADLIKILEKTENK